MFLIDWSLPREKNVKYWFSKITEIAIREWRVTRKSPTDNAINQIVTSASAGKAFQDTWHMRWYSPSSGWMPKSPEASKGRSPNQPLALCKNIRWARKHKLADISCKRVWCSHKKTLWLKQFFFQIAIKISFNGFDGHRHIDQWILLKHLEDHIWRLKMLISRTLSSITS